jgi:hypothetical protein
VQGIKKEKTPYRFDCIKVKKIQWYSINISIPKGRNQRIARRDQTEARPKPSRANIIYCSSMSSI